MNLVKIIRADFGSDLPSRSKYSVKEKLIGFLTLVRPIFLLLTPINAASAAVLSIRGLPSWETCLVGFITGAFAAAGVNIYNRFADRQRDNIMWPRRSIPSGRVKASKALALALLAYTAALALCWFYFNPTAFGILLAAIVLGSLYSSFLRDRVGYLSLPPIEGLIFLCGWACLSPQDVFTSPLPWYLYLLGLVWQSGHIMAHYVLNVRFDPEGKPVVLTPALFSRPLPGMASRITLGFTLLLFVMSITLILLTPLSYLYLVPVAVSGIYTLWQCLAFIRKSGNKVNMHRAWSSLSLFRLIISAGIILSVLVYP
ncbi:MAG: UbiA prenyltransferase family protein [Dehalococcoidales bacterium]|nr:UbiA prenyltransferase family protein [Dehalococcoidales bacterium]